MRCNRWMQAIPVALMLFGMAGVGGAHHSQAMFVDVPVWVAGTILRYRAVDPNVMIELAEPRPDGPARRWIIEGPRMGRLDAILRNNGGLRPDQLLRVGDRIAACGFPLKQDFDPARLYADWPPEQGRFVHGQVLVMPDGHLQSWGPYGHIDHCVRATDAARDWVTFLDRDPLAHQQWCVVAAREPAASPAARQITNSLATPCRMNP